MVDKKFYATYMEEEQPKIKEFDDEQLARNFCENNKPCNLYLQEGDTFWERVDCYE